MLSLIEHITFFANYDKKPAKFHLGISISLQFQRTTSWILNFYLEFTLSMCVTTFELFNWFIKTVVRVLKVINCE